MMKNKIMVFFENNIYNIFFNLIIFVAFFVIVSTVGIHGADDYNACLPYMQDMSWE